MKHGFTLVELIVVIAIIGLLATIGISSYMQILREARDTKRKTDLEEISKALQYYYFKNGTYRLPNAGSRYAEGQGWLSVDSSTQPTYYLDTSIVEALYNEGYLEVTSVFEPQPTALDYLLVLCENAQVYALFAQLENPSTEDIAKANTACGVAVNAPWNPVTQYSKNFVITNKTY